MALRFVLDENVRGGGLWQAIQQHNAAGAPPVDAVRVGDPPDLPLGTVDSELLRWSEREGRILVSLDVRTLPAHLASHLAAGRHSEGVIIIRRRCTVSQALLELVLIAHAGDPAAYRDRVTFIP